MYTQDQPAFMENVGKKEKSKKKSKEKAAPVKKLKLSDATLGENLKNKKDTLKCKLPNKE